MKGAKRWLFTQEYRFRLGQSLLTFVNFSLLVVSASPKLEWLTGLGRTRYVVMLLVPSAFVCVWIAGWIMDRWLKAPQEQNRIANSRNVEISEIKAAVERIERRLKCE